MSAYYDSTAWSAGRQPSWEAPAPPSRSGTSSTVQRDEPNAFLSQLEGQCSLARPLARCSQMAEIPADGSTTAAVVPLNFVTQQPSPTRPCANCHPEVDRAIDNLYKSGKMPFFGVPGVPRRDSMPPMGRAYGGGGDYDPRGMNSQRHHSVSDYDGIRSHSAQNLQGYYANQRFAPRPNEADQMMQAKRRMAAQRERELRNYHQEQQYNRNISGAKSDRSMSPNAMSEEERRELIARQHRALYGENSTLYPDSRQPSQDVRVQTSLAGRGTSPLAFDPFGMSAPTKQGGEPPVQMPPRDGKDAGVGAQRSRANSTSSPASNQAASFSLFETAQQSSRTSNSSPTGGSPPRQGGVGIKAPGSAGVAPIGTRPVQPSGQVANPALSKRSTTPLPSPLSYGFTVSDQHHAAAAAAAAAAAGTSAASNPSSATDKNTAATVSGLGWGGNSGVWGSSKGSLGVQASVWG
ncbi:hypothetical protein JOL62DRAFT_593509 [Phyllosticta paracitricarpa]|uniref:Uncharacterized protein n=1 Tax=Phyllosticta paracitricarpa TaxID=2016321 RepID=A0ABR1N173_9PEZI